MQPSRRDPYSYRDDPAIKAFDDSRIVLVMDGNCAICSGAARRIARFDKNDAVRITTAQGQLGAALLRHYGFNPDDPASWLMLAEGNAFGSLDAMLRLGRRLHPGFLIFAPLRLIPLRLQDWLYARLARNRYALFGHDDLCAMPDGALRHRLIE